MGSATALADLLDTVLASAVAAVAQTRTGSPPPGLVGLTHGPPAIDACEGAGRLAVYLEVIEPTYLSARLGVALPTGRCAVTSSARIVIELWRCLPVPDALGNPPSPAAEDAAAGGLAIDAWCLYTGILGDALAGNIAPGGQCDTVLVEPCEVLEPAGGAGGIKLPLLVQLDAGGPPPSS